MTGWRWIGLTLLLVACGSPAPAAEEVTEAWTAGDDAPLESEDAEP